MPPATRIHFERSSRLPSPWVLSRQTGCSSQRIHASFTLLRIGCAAGMRFKRASARAALDAELQMAAGRPVRWRESPKGPEVLESVGNGRVGVSLSYAQSEAWLALGWDGPIGLDAVAIEPVLEWEEVALVYLEPMAQERLRLSRRADLDFAREWAGYEARLKLGGLALGEGVTPPPALVVEATIDKVAVAVALPLEATFGMLGDEPDGWAQGSQSVSRLDGYSEGA